MSHFADRARNLDVLSAVFGSDVGRRDGCVQWREYRSVPETADHKHVPIVHLRRDDLVHVEKRHAADIQLPLHSHSPLADEGAQCAPGNTSGGCVSPSNENDNYAAGKSRMHSIVAVPAFEPLFRLETLQPERAA